MARKEAIHTRLRAIVIIGALTLGVFFTPLTVVAQQAVFLLRHAEQANGSDDPPLTEAGQRRARALVTALKDAGITAIYTSEFQRTIQTAGPLAKALNIEPKIMPRADIDGLIKQLHAQHADGRVLIVSHSLTVPHLLKALGHPVEVAVARDEYDRLFMIVPKSAGPPLVFLLRF
jgi:broad specificity phosphatase PhoE